MLRHGGRQHFLCRTPCASERHATARNVLVTKIGQDVHAAPYAFAADPALRLGIVNRYLYGPGWEDWIEGLRRKKRAVVARDVPQLMRLLDAGRIDAFPAIPVGSAARARLYGPHANLRRLRCFENSDAAKGGLAVVAQFARRCRARRHRAGVA